MGGTQQKQAVFQNYPAESIAALQSKAAFPFNNQGSVGSAHVAADQHTVVGCGIVYCQGVYHLHMPVGRHLGPGLQGGIAHNPVLAAVGRGPYGTGQATVFERGHFEYAVLYNHRPGKTVVGVLYGQQAPAAFAQSALAADDSPTAQTEGFFVFEHQLSHRHGFVDHNLFVNSRVCKTDTVAGHKDRSSVLPVEIGSGKVPGVVFVTHPKNRGRFARRFDFQRNAVFCYIKVVRKAFQSE